jgi:outer membrane protein OmpA-like peptidoglycan-associated protein
MRQFQHTFVKISAVLGLVAIVGFMTNSLHAQVGTVITVAGSVFDEVTRNPATVNVVFSDEAGTRAGSSRSNSKDGSYLVTGLKPGKKYKVRIEQPEFFQAEYEIQLPNTSKYTEISRDFLVKPLVKGTRIPARLAPFELKKSKLRVGANEILDDFKRTLIINPSVNIEIQCFPDMDGDKAENTKLTQDRCNALREYLVKSGVSDKRISTKSSDSIDSINPPPLRKAAKGKRYIGSTYFVVTKF